MNLIETYLNGEHSIDSLKLDTQEAKLDFFYKLFSDLKIKYETNLDDMKRLEFQHKAELNKLEDYVYKVKSLTEERENLTIDFKDENNELKNKIKALERELAIADEYRNSSLNRLKSDMSTDGDDDLSEETIEMLVLEGFGNIVAAPNHEKIACLLADRTKLLSELNYLKNEKLSATAAAESSPSPSSPLAPPVSTNEKITNEKLRLLNEKIELLDNENMSLKDLNIRLKNQIDDSTKSIKNYENQIKDLLNSSNNNENNTIKTKTKGKDSDEEDIIEASKLEINKLKQDNLNLKMEIDKLYDEIGHLEIETKQLRDENKKLFTELNELTEMEKSEISKDAMEIKKLKKEIDDLNNELDDLVQYKANYELSKKENEKLLSQIKELEVITSEKQEEKSSFLKSSISQPNIAALVAPLSPLAKLKNSGMSNDKLSSPNKQQSSSQLEIDWIRRENENLLIDLEKTQTKLDEKIAQYNELKNQMAVKDEQMKIFISKYEKQQTTKDDLLNLQMKILDLEEALNNEKEKHLKELDANETKQNDLLKRNDHLWSQLTNLEQSYNDALELIQIQTKENENMLSKIKEYEKQVSELNDEKQSSLMIIEKMRGKNDNLELEIDNLNQVVNKLNLDLEALTETNHKNEDKNKKEVNGLNKKITELEREIENLKKLNFDLKFEVDALMKEKSFIINQNDSTQQKVLQDYLSLQEKHADTKIELNKLKNEHSVIELSIKEKDQLIKGLELDNNQLNLSLKSEINEKKEALEKIKTLDKTNLQNNSKLIELNDKISKLESQKNVLEIKTKELDSLKVNYSKLEDELIEKTNTITRIFEKNSRLEVDIVNLERQINDAKNAIKTNEAQIGDLNHIRNETLKKSEELIKLKHDYETEKLKREKSESKIEDLREEAKKAKQRLSKLQDEHNRLKNENLDSNSQLNNLKSKLNIIADKNHTEYEKNSTLENELNEARKKVEIIESKCNSYSQKFDILMKRYEQRKVKHKAKMERLWEFMQKERARFKELLANAHSEINNTKSLIEKENQNKNKQDLSFQEILEEKSKLLTTVVEKETKMREMKRQIFNLQSRIKYLEEENQNINEKMDNIAKERNKLRKENQFSNLRIPIKADHGDGFLIPRANSNGKINLNLSGPISSDPFDKSVRTSYDNNYYDLNALSSWDVNYNTGSFSKLRERASLSLKNIIQSPIVQKN